MQCETCEHIEYFKTEGVRFNDVHGISYIQDFFHF
jgi:hypothetical protein